MAEDIVKQIMLLRNFIITTAVGTLLLTAAFFVCSRQFSFRRQNMKLMGFLFDMRMRDTFMLSASLLKVFFVLSLLFSGGKIERIHVLFFGILAIGCNFGGKKGKDMLVGLFNGAVMTGVLFVAGLLSSYLRDVLFDFKIAAALVALAVFLMLYTLYDTGCCILSIVENQEWDGVGKSGAEKRKEKKEKKVGKEGPEDEA